MPDDAGFDVIWCQWCLGHLSDADLVAFFRRCKSALRDPKRSVIVVKENVCADAFGGTARTEFDEEDSSLTRCASTVFFCLLSLTHSPQCVISCRSETAWKKCFAEAGLDLFCERVQLGLPEGLYVVKM